MNKLNKKEERKKNHNQITWRTNLLPSSLMKLLLVYAALLMSHSQLFTPYSLRSCMHMLTLINSLIFLMHRLSKSHHNFWINEKKEIRFIFYTQIKFQFRNRRQVVSCQHPQYANIDYEACSNTEEEEEKKNEYLNCVRTHEKWQIFTDKCKRCVISNYL